jgi:hypothetical protein
MKIRYLLRESAKIEQNGEKQKLVDPYDSLHTAQVDDWLTVSLDKFQQFAQSAGLKFFNSDEVPSREDGGRGAYKLSVNAISLNQRRESDEYAHILKVKITGQGKNDSDSRDYVYYVMYSDDDFSRSFVGSRLYPVERVDQLPIYATNTGIGSTQHSDRDYWKYVAEDHQNTRGQDNLLPGDFPQLNKHSFIDNYGTTGVAGGGGKSQAAINRRKTELDIPDDSMPDEERQGHLAANQQEIQHQNQAILKAVTSKKLTAAKMVQTIKNSKGSGGSYRSKKAMTYLSELMEAFTESPNNPGSIYPLQFTQTTSGQELMADIGIQGVNSIVISFMTRLISIRQCCRFM